MGGFAGSRILEVHGERMIKRTFDPGFRIRLHRKDLGLADRLRPRARPRAAQRRDRRAADERRHRPRRRRPRPFRPDPHPGGARRRVALARRLLPPTAGRPALRGPAPHAQGVAVAPQSPSCRCRSAPSTSASPTRRARTGSATTASPPRTGSTSSATGSCGRRSSARPASTTGTTTTARWTSPPRTASSTIIAELTHTVPDWAMRKFAHARQLRARRHARCPRSWASRSATGGFANNGGGAGALTMNCPEVKEAAGAFLTALATRYRDHPGMFGYDVWNETNYSPDVDYNPYTKAAFRDWLKAKYGNLDDARRGLAPLRPRRVGGRRAAGRRSAPTRNASTGSPSSATTSTARCSGASTPSAPSTRRT